MKFRVEVVAGGGKVHSFDVEDDVRAFDTGYSLYIYPAGLEAGKKDKSIAPDAYTPRLKMGPVVVKVNCGIGLLNPSGRWEEWGRHPNLECAIAFMKKEWPRSHYRVWTVNSGEYLYDSIVDGK